MTTKSEAPSAGFFTVLVDDNFAFMHEDERTVYGRFPTYAEAVAACRGIVDRWLERHRKPGMSPEELIEAYTSFGDDPFLDPNPGMEELRNAPREEFDARRGKLVEECLNSPDYLAGMFSAWDYAKKRASEVCLEKESLKCLRHAATSSVMG